MAATRGSSSEADYWPAGNGAEVCTAGYGGGVSSAHATAPLPTRNKDGVFIFEDAPLLRPNLAPWEVIRAGAFGGGYFRKITSGVTGQKYANAHKEFPAEWFEGLDTSESVTSGTYRESANLYGVKCGSDLEAWESKGWIHESSPFGWFQWYCRFFMGLRGEDDERQISRWNKCAGIKSGRWLRNLVGKVARANAAADDARVSPVVRQTLLHWAYSLTDKDFQRIAKDRGLTQTAGGSKRSRPSPAESRASKSKAKK